MMGAKSGEWVNSNLDRSNRRETPRRRNSSGGFDPSGRRTDIVHETWTGRRSKRTAPTPTPTVEKENNFNAFECHWPSLESAAVGPSRPRCKSLGGMQKPPLTSARGANARRSVGGIWQSRSNLNADPNPQNELSDQPGSISSSASLADSQDDIKDDQESKTTGNISDPIAPAAAEPRDLTEIKRDLDSCSSNFKSDQVSSDLQVEAAGCKSDFKAEDELIKHAEADALVRIEDPILSAAADRDVTDIRHVACSGSGSDKSDQNSSDPQPEVETCSSDLKTNGDSFKDTEALDSSHTVGKTTPATTGPDFADWLEERPAMLRIGPAAGMGWEFPLSTVEKRDLLILNLSSEFLVQRNEIERQGEVIDMLRHEVQDPVNACRGTAPTA